MGHDHAHGVSASAKNKKPLFIVLSLTTVYMIAEVIGGWLTNSLALLADAGHMLTDVGGLALALLAIKFAERPATPSRTYGYYRVEILAALTNAVVLIVISGLVLYEAYERFRNPPEVASTTMLIVATIGLIVNIAGVFILRAGSKESLNMKGAYFEVMSDFLTSIGVIVAGIIMLTTGWYYADPLISAGIGLFILPRTWALMRDAVGVLLEGTPADVNLANLRASLCAIDGVFDVHDLHVWSLTSGLNALSVHAVIDGNVPYDTVLNRVHECCLHEYKISHVTVQPEPRDFAEHETHL